MKDSARGKIKTLRQIDCLKCRSIDYMPGIKSKCTSHWRLSGWTRVKGNWVCSKCVFLLFLLFAGSLQAQLTNSFAIKQELTLFQQKMKVVSSEGADIGEIKKDVFALTTNFTYYDSQKRQSARAEEQFLAWGHISKIYDGAGKLLGSVNERIFSSLFSTFNVYEILDSTGKLLAKSQRTTLFATNIEIDGLDGAKIATVDRPMLQLFDKWTVTIVPGSIDPRLILFIGAYKTDADSSK